MVASSRAGGSAMRLVIRSVIPSGNSRFFPLNREFCRCLPMEGPFAAKTAGRFKYLRGNSRSRPKREFAAPERELRESVEVR
jgi:hypothetical protein